MTHDLVLLARAADYAARQHIAQRRKGERGRALRQSPDRSGGAARRGDGWRRRRAADGWPAARHAGGHRCDLRGPGAALRPGGRGARCRGDRRQVAAQGGAQAPADREDAGQVAARETAEARRQDLQPARPDAKPAGGWTEERLRDYVVWAEAVVRSCRGLNPELEAGFDAAYAEARQRFGA